MNATEPPLCQVRSGVEPRPAVPEQGSEDEGNRFAGGRPILALCVMLSLALHAVLPLGFEFRQIGRKAARTLLLEVVTPAAKAPEPPARSAARVVPEAGRPQVQPGVPPPARKTVSRPRQPRQPAGQGQKRASAPSPQRSIQTKAQDVRPPKADVNEAAYRETRAPVGQVAKRPDATVLANESGQDALKHGAEARFMHGVATEEFVEENYVGEYTLGDAGRVWIEDDRARSGHLILHAEGMGLHTKLFRFNRFIYVYGDDADSPSPILGSVTFFSDGYHIHQFLWQHNSTQAFFPRRNE